MEPSPTTPSGDELLELLVKTYVHSWPCANLVTDGATVANVIAFPSGWRDGFYPSNWGYDAADRRVALETDFGVLDDSGLAS